MSTKIYNAVILPYDSISEIVTEMHKIQKMELDNLEAELANGLYGLMRQGKANAIRELFSSKARKDADGANYSRKRRTFREAAAAFIILSRIPRLNLTIQAWMNAQTSFFRINIKFRRNRNFPEFTGIHVFEVHSGMGFKYS